jgi:hypothetical protein
LAPKRDHGKEIGAAFYFDTSVFRHLFWCVRRTLRSGTFGRHIATEPFFSS